jgi:hypothetical protein
MTEFRLAPMSRVIRALTIVVLVVPVVLFVFAAVASRLLLGPALFVTVIYGAVWFWLRPDRFVVHAGTLEVVWPLRREQIPRADIVGVRLVETRDLRREVGWCLRVGAGGLWGGFGWLWTQRRGIVRMYVSRTDGLVWIECAGGRPWLISPERPETFVLALSRQPAVTPGGGPRWRPRC